MSTGLRRLLQVSFALLIVAQLAWIGRLAHRRLQPDPAPPPPPPALAVGHVLDSVRIDTLGGTATVSLSGSHRWTLLFAYSSTCAFCDSVASEWSTYMREERRLQLAAVSRGPVEDARAYTARWDWSVVAGELRETFPEDRVLWITRRTPMLFLFDSTGALVWNGHGEDLRLIDSLVGLAGRDH